MPTLAKPSFSIGEISEFLFHRIDLAQHAYACAKVFNSIVKPDGTVVRRPGTRRVSATAGATSKSCLYLFRFALTDVYVLEFREDLVRILDTSGILEDSVVTEYTEQEIFELSITQLNDTIFIAHPAHRTMTLVRGVAGWTFGDYFQLGLGTGRGDINTTVRQAWVKVGTSGVSGEFRVESTASLYNWIPVWAGGDLPNTGTFYIEDPDTLVWHALPYVEVLGGGGEYILRGMIADIDPPLSPTTKDIAATRLWAFDSTTPSGPMLGNPAVTFFYQQRFCLAASVYEPKTVAMSGTGLYLTFDRTEVTLTDDSPLRLSITAGVDATPIYWAVSLKYLILNVGSSLIWLSSATGSGAITARSKQASLGSYISLSYVKPVLVNDELIAVGSDRRSIFSVGVRTDDDEFPVAELTVLNSELFSESKIKQIAYQRSPWPIIWALTDDGKIKGLSYSKELQLSAWHTHEIAAAEGETAFVESILSVPGDTGEDLWMSVNRNGTQTIEFLRFYRDEYATPSSWEDMQSFMDNAVNSEQTGWVGHAFDSEITPLMPLYEDRNGPVDGDEVGIRNIGLSVKSEYPFTVATAGGEVEVAVEDVSSSGNVILKNLPPLISDDTKVTVKTSAERPFTLIAIRYQMEE